MKSITLIFPDVSTLVEFVLMNHISNAGVRSMEQSLTATLTQDEIETAQRDYQAVIKTNGFTFYY